MKSFRTEIENPIVEKDILDLEQKIHDFHNNNIDEEKFRSLRLARGVYGQRQQGVQMIRIKLPLGKFTAQQLLRMAEVQMSLLRETFTSPLAKTYNCIMFLWTEHQNYGPLWKGIKSP